MIDSVVREDTGEKIDPEVFMRQFRELEVSDKNELLKWLSDLGDELVDSGLQSIGGEIFPILSEELVKRSSQELEETLAQAWETYDSSSTSGGIIDSYSHCFRHMIHIKEGKDYDSDCKVCQA